MPPCSSTIVVCHIESVWRMDGTGGLSRKVFWGCRMMCLHHIIFFKPSFKHYLILGNQAMWMHFTQHVLYVLFSVQTDDLSVCPSLCPCHMWKLLIAYILALQCFALFNTLVEFELFSIIASKGNRMKYIQYLGEKQRLIYFLSNMQLLMGKLRICSKDSVVKATCCSFGVWFSAPTLGSSQLYIAPPPGDQMC